MCSLSSWSVRRSLVRTPVWLWVNILPRLWLAMVFRYSVQASIGKADTRPTEHAWYCIATCSFLDKGSTPGFSTLVLSETHCGCASAALKLLIWSKAPQASRNHNNRHKSLTSWVNHKVRSINKIGSTQGGDYCQEKIKLTNALCSKSTEGFCKKKNPHSLKQGWYFPQDKLIHQLPRWALPECGHVQLNLAVPTTRKLFEVVVPTPNSWFIFWRLLYHQLKPNQAQWAHPRMLTCKYTVTWTKWEYHKYRMWLTTKLWTLLQVHSSGNVCGYSESSEQIRHHLTFHTRNILIFVGAIQMITSPNILTVSAWFGTSNT